MSHQQFNTSEPISESLTSSERRKGKKVKKVKKSESSQYS
jgi:hypothetical protein